jgi:hypothetical protein
MPPQQKDLALRSIQIARQGLDITVNSPAYREGMKYGQFRQDNPKFFSYRFSSRALHSCNCYVCRLLLVAIVSPFVRRLVRISKTRLR